MIIVFAVILNWNREKDTIECINSLKKAKTDGLLLKIVVVDNASSKGIKDIEKIENIKVIKNKENLGFAGGNNVGIRYALENGADFLLLLNNDTLVDEKLIIQLLEVAEKRKGSGVLSPKIYFAPGYEFHKDQYKPSERGKVIWYAGGKVDWDNVYGSNHGVDQIDKGEFNELTETDFATGAAMFLRREALKDAGLFDEKYFMYLEDVDLSLRMKRKDWRVLYAPPAHLWHKVAQSSAIGGGLNDYYTTRNRLLFGMRYAPLRTKIALFRESIKLLAGGRKWQRRGVLDFYLGRFGKGSWKFQ